MKVVIDSNVMISGLLWKGPSKQIIDLALKKKIKICVTSSILEEVFEVLSRKKFRSIFRANDITLLELKDKITHLVYIFPDKIELNLVKDDPSDNKFLECALTAGVKYIISGDQYLLKLKQFQSVFIISPQQFLKVLKQK